MSSVETLGVVSKLDRTPLPERDADLRQRIRDYARDHGERYSARLFDLWDKWNERYFDALMTPALILLDEPGSPTLYGQCSLYSGLAGCRCQIQLRPSILAGTLRDLRHGSRNPEGLRRFLEDVLLHEMIHQYHFEITGDDDASYGGHGPAFSGKANEIGEELALPRVRRTCKSRDGDAPSPSQWPYNVRPESYYLGAHVLASVDKPTTPALEVAVAALIRDHGADAFREVSERLLTKNGGES